VADAQANDDRTLPQELKPGNLEKQETLGKSQRPQNVQCQSWSRPGENLRPRKPKPGDPKPTATATLGMTQTLREEDRLPKLSRDSLAPQ